MCALTHMKKMVDPLTICVETKAGNKVLFRE